MAPRFLLVMVLLAFSGCAAPSASPDAGAPSLGAPSVERVAFLASDMSLAAAREEQEKGTPAGSFFAAWAAGEDYPTWREKEPRAEGAVVENLSAHLRVRATGPVARTFRFPDLMAYGGSGEAWMALGTVQTPPVLVPGETYVFDVALTLPQGGLWVPVGERLGVKVVPVMHQNEGADVEIVTGGADASALRWVERASGARFPEDATPGSAQGEVAGSAYAGDAAPPSVRHRTVVKLDAPRGLVAWMNTTDNQGIPDLDLSVVGPDGRELAFAGTPTPREMLRLGLANFGGPGDHTLVVTNYGSARATFSLEWRAG